MNGERQTNIHLDIAFDYPIGWSFERALRDFIQNFYDAIGRERFGDALSYKYEIDNESGKYWLEMKTHGYPFSYELLSYIGGSTKDKNDNAIGKYGEGFKMASLCIYKMGMDFVMHSQNWEIKPAKYMEIIDGVNVEMFGYSLEESEDDEDTVLKIEGIPQEYENALNEALFDFFYSDNELFGELLGKGEGYDVYSRSDVEIPCKQEHKDLKGILYINNLARGRLNIPIIVNYGDKYVSDQRSRPTLDKMQTSNSLYCCMERWDSDTSGKVLRIMKKYWSDIPLGARDVDTKYYYICQLVRNVVRDEGIAKSFREEIEEYGYLERKTSNNVRNRYIDEAKHWWMNNSGKRLLNPIFRKLGAENVVDRYIARRFDYYRELTNYEQARADMLLKCLIDVIPILDNEDMPKIVIDLSGEEKVDPLQFATRVFDKRSGKRGRKYKIEKVVLKEEDFENKAFFETFLKTAEAILQVYGSAKSSKYNAIFTKLGTYILKSDEIITQAHDMWERAGNA